MKWGVRRYQNKDGSLTSLGKKRNPKNIWNKDYKKEERSVDELIFGRSAVKRINKRMNKGKSHTQAELIEFGRQSTISALTAVGTMDVLTGGALHRAVGKKITDSYLKSKAAKSVVKITQNHYFDPIDTVFKEL